MNLPIKKLLIASGNSGKIEEFKNLLKNIPVNIISLSGLNIKEPEENGLSFAENAEIKARYYYENINIPSLADDSGLAIDQLDGEPGIYSARWAGKDKNFTNAINKIEKKLIKNNINLDQVTGSFYCALALMISEDIIIHSLGKVSGKIIFPGKGGNGFGYDPIFIPYGQTKTFAELTKFEKENISHRKLALKNLLAKLTN